MNCRDFFRFKQFEICQDGVLMKITTDSVLLGAWSKKEGVQNVLDIGTGTGVIACMLAQKYPEAHVEALEYDKLSVSVARKNFNNCPFSNQLSLIYKDLREFTPDKKYDLIVTNPPFFKPPVKGNVNPSRHDEGLPLPVIFRFVSRYLEEKGKFCMIFPFDRTQEILEQAYESDMYVLEKIEVSDRPDASVKRVLWSFVKNPDREFENRKEFLFYSNGQPTGFYKKLTSDFLLD